MQLRNRAGEKWKCAALLKMNPQKLILHCSLDDEVPRVRPGNPSFRASAAVECEDDFNGSRGQQPFFRKWQVVAAPVPKKPHEIGKRRRRNVALKTDRIAFRCHNS